MKKAVIGAALSLANLALVGGMIVASMNVPANAQGVSGTFRKPFGNAGCPTGYKSGKSKDDNCYPARDNAPAVFPRRSTSDQCPQGYFGDGNYCVEGTRDSTPAADRLVSYGTITKANKLDRCPLGYFSKSDMTICTTRLSPAPKSRKKTGPCNSNEIDEWGLYCTADANVITRAQAQQEADRDFNAIYSANGAQYPAQGSDTENYPSMVAAYGPKGGGSANGASAASSDASQTAQSSGCANGSATGAAIGGAMAGEGGAALGSMLGGLGKKKKKAGC